MKLTLIMAAALVAGTGLAPAQEAAPTRTDLQWHDSLGQECRQRERNGTRDAYRQKGKPLVTVVK